MKDRVEKYLRFDLIGLSTSGLTQIWQLTDLKYSVPCGFVKWSGAWRKYVFEELEGTSYWDSDALDMIATFLRDQNTHHRDAHPGGSTTN